jgi:hypothetical protein
MSSCCTLTKKSAAEFVGPEMAESGWMDGWHLTSRALSLCKAEDARVTPIYLSRSYSASRSTRAPLSRCGGVNIPLAPLLLCLVESWLPKIHPCVTLSGCTMPLCRALALSHITAPRFSLTGCAGGAEYFYHSP